MSKKLKRFKRLVRRPFEWLGIGLGWLVFAHVSHRMLFRICDFIAAVGYPFDRKGRELSRENLRLVVGTEHLTPRREELILKRSYRNMARTVGHAFWTCRDAAKRAAEAGELSEECRRFLAENKPAVTVSGHIGCWEILSQLAYLEGHSMMSVAKDIGTPGMTALLMRARRSIGQEIVHADGAFKPLMQGLKDGKSLGLLVDQSVSPKHGGVWVRFFGYPMSVSAAPAFFGAKGKVPIAVAWSRPLRDGRYRCEVVDVIPPSEARDVWRTTQRCADDLARIVRRHPSCWVLNYNFFSNWPRPEDIEALEAREAKAR